MKKKLLSYLVSMLESEEVKSEVQERKVKQIPVYIMGELSGYVARPS